MSNSKLSIITNYRILRHLESAGIMKDLYSQKPKEEMKERLVNACNDILKIKNRREVVLDSECGPIFNRFPFLDEMYVLMEEIEFFCRNFLIRRGWVQMGNTYPNTSPNFFNMGIIHFEKPQFDGIPIVFRCVYNSYRLNTESAGNVVDRLPVINPPHAWPLEVQCFLDCGTCKQADINGDNVADFVTASKEVTEVYQYIRKIIKEHPDMEVKFTSEKPNIK